MDNNKKNILITTLVICYLLVFNNSVAVGFSMIFGHALNAKGVIANTRAHNNNTSISTDLNDASNDNDLELYTGKVYHIFFHSLILDARAAFASSNSNGYNYWMVTRQEFSKLLPLLYEQNFILIDINSLAKKDRQGKVIKRDLYLPKGKKPLVISIDDVNYYEYMKGQGFADRLAVDKNGDLTAIVNRNGKEFYDDEGDVMLIIDKFVKKHADFSFNGAKGVVAVTGYQGVFGYRITSLQGDALKTAKQQATLVANKLKQSGWTIACHSYSHSSAFRDGSISMDKLQKDLTLWQNHIAPIVGETEIFIPPFGYGFSPQDDRFKYIVNKGYHIICPVYKEMNLIYGNNYMIQERLNIDGFTLIKYPERIRKYFFDPAFMLDNARPALI